MREFALLQHVFAANPALPPWVSIPPGDDMGAVRLASGSEVLVTVDQVADGVHFDLRTAPLEKVGRKAVTRNLSDLAAMAVKPLGAVAAACLPRDFGQDRALRLFDAMRATAAAYACPLVGGDLSSWDHPLLLSVTILAEPWPAIAPVRRSGARAGDAVCVTGVLGGSLASGHHLDFEPRIALARELAGRFPLHAMIDLSDGLARDLGHVCEMSGVSAVLDRPLPLSPAARRAPDPERCALADGEDYELCFTLAPDDAAALPPELAGVPLACIGGIVAAEGRPRVQWRGADGRLQDVAGLGWEHHGP